METGHHLRIAVISPATIPTQEFEMGEAIKGVVDGLTRRGHSLEIFGGSGFTPKIRSSADPERVMGSIRDYVHANRGDFDVALDFAGHLINSVGRSHEATLLPYLLMGVKYLPFLIDPDYYKPIPEVTKRWIMVCGHVESATDLTDVRKLAYQLDLPVIFAGKYHKKLEKQLPFVEGDVRFISNDYPWLYARSFAHVWLSPRWHYGLELRIARAALSGITSIVYDSGFMSSLIPGVGHLVKDVEQARMAIIAAADDPQVIRGVALERWNAEAMLSHLEQSLYRL